MIKLKRKFTHSLLVPTSMGVRLTPLNRQPMHCGGLMQMQATSAETNVASVSSYLGVPVKVLTAFVKDSPIARFIKDDLAGRHMDYEGPEIEQDGPWGCRHQFNLADGGFGARGPRVHNDRAGEVGRELNVKYFDLEKIFKKDGAQIIHLSGLIAALSPSTGTFCLKLADAAKKNGTLVSFDLNYRASFWVNRKKELSKLFANIADKADILIGNEEDFQLCLGIKGPGAGGENLAEEIEAFKDMIHRAESAFPNASVFATTLRETISANGHLWGGILYDKKSRKEKWQTVAPREIQVHDRIGGGDGFVGGMLYGIIKGWEAEKCIQFGWACGALTATLETDYAQPLHEDQVWNIWKGNSRVDR